MDEKRVSASQIMTGISSSGTVFINPYLDHSQGGQVAWHGIFGDGKTGWRQQLESRESRGSGQAFSGDDLVPLRFQHMFSTVSHVVPKESGALAGMFVWLSAACKVPFSRLPKKVSQDCDGEQPLQTDRTG